MGDNCKKNVPKEVTFEKHKEKGLANTYTL